MGLIVPTAGVGKSAEALQWHFIKLRLMASHRKKAAETLPWPRS